MDGKIKAGDLFSIIWRSWVALVVIFFIPFSLLMIPMVLISDGISGLGMLVLSIVAMPFLAALQGIMLGGMVCLGYIAAPKKWLEYGRTNQSKKSPASQAGTH